jgi:phospholipase/carboxylesterase
MDRRNDTRIRMTLATIELCPPGVAKSALIILHGLGADGTDFIPMCDALDLQRHGPVRCIMPRAPERPVTINGGMRMRAWYDVLGADLQQREDEAGLRASLRDVHALIGREVARGVPARRIVLAGFSQGCAVALLAGLRFRNGSPARRPVRYFRSRSTGSARPRIATCRSSSPTAATTASCRSRAAAHRATH